MAGTGTTAEYEIKPLNDKPVILAGDDAFSIYQAIVKLADAIVRLSNKLK